MGTRMTTYSINAGRKLMDLSHPMVMGILNVTPDSFHKSVNPYGKDSCPIICETVRKMLSDGADVIDVGGCSTRPDSRPVNSDEEWRRLSMALETIRLNIPDCIVSVDTFRAEIAERCIREYGVEIVNDISGGDEDMYDLVSRESVPYILTYNESHLNRSHTVSVNEMPVCKRAMLFFSRRIQSLRDRGAKDIILDPGFGFNKTITENYELLSHLNAFDMLELPILVGVSYKRMVYEVLGCTHNEAANGTTAVNTMALMKGAKILRVHDVKAARECVRLWEIMTENAF